tara:strand:- start:554 stop:2260 length:1707 start_codon:yes stop_codon:yes gene_type:complete
MGWWTIPAVMGGTALVDRFLGGSGEDYSQEQKDLLELQHDIGQFQLDEYKRRAEVGERFMTPMMESVFGYGSQQLGKPRDVSWAHGVFEPKLAERESLAFDVPSGDFGHREAAQPEPIDQVDWSYPTPPDGPRGPGPLRTSMSNWAPNDLTQYLAYQGPYARDAESARDVEMDRWVTDGSIDIPDAITTMYDGLLARQDDDLWDYGDQEGGGPSLQARMEDYYDKYIKPNLEKAGIEVGSGPYGQPTTYEKDPVTGLPEGPVGVTANLPPGTDGSVGGREITDHDARGGFQFGIDPTSLFGVGWDLVRGDNPFESPYSDIKTGEAIELTDLSSEQFLEKFPDAVEMPPSFGGAEWDSVRKFLTGFGLSSYDGDFNIKQTSDGRNFVHVADPEILEHLMTHMRMLQYPSSTASSFPEDFELSGDYRLGENGTSDTPPRSQTEDGVVYNAAGQVVSREPSSEGDLAGDPEPDPIRTGAQHGHPPTTRHRGDASEHEHGSEIEDASGVGEIFFPGDDGFGQQAANESWDNMGSVLDRMVSLSQEFPDLDADSISALAMMSPEEFETWVYSS